jgi:hypothetical protein
MNSQPSAVPSAVPSADESRIRYLKRLAVASDEGVPYGIRVAALRAALPSGHFLKDAPDRELSGRLSRPWDVRSYLMSGRGVERKVQRPPTCLSDVIKV